MKILIIGNGGREFALALRLKADNNDIFIAPGNAASNAIAKNINIQNFNELALWAKNEGIDLCVVGPENALDAGVVDIFKEQGLAIFGPSKAAAKLESSKTFMKDFLAKNNIRTAAFLNTHDYSHACEFIDEIFAKNASKVVIKADGLCAGKGVIIANNADEAKMATKDMLNGQSFGDAGKRVVIEEFLDGFELSFFAICDGENFLSLPVAQDHKKLLDGDMGPNTGGMGAYAPSMLASSDLILRVENEILRPSLEGMKRDGTPFCGVLFIGLMIVDNEPFVLEYNVRFGDPECEVLMPLIGGDFGEILLKAANGELENIKLNGRFAVGVVMASKDYPYKSSQTQIISIDNKELSVNEATFYNTNDCHICFAGVSQINGKLAANGGRVLVCVGLGDSIEKAQAKAYELAKKISFTGAQYRKDIAYQALR